MPTYEIRAPSKNTPRPPSAGFPLVLDAHLEAASPRAAIEAAMARIKLAAEQTNMIPAHGEVFRLLVVDRETGDRTVYRLVYRVQYMTAAFEDPNFELPDEPTPQDRANAGLPKAAREALAKDNAHKAASKAPPSLEAMLDEGKDELIYEDANDEDFEP